MQEVQPYLMFDGNCEEALQFYQTTLGARLEMLMRYKENPDKPAPGTIPPGSDDKVMHAALYIGKSLVMASDDCFGHPKFSGFSLSLTVDSEAEADRVFNALAEGGKVQMPLGKTFFAKRFGMVADRFGVSWMVILG